MNAVSSLIEQIVLSTRCKCTFPLISPRESWLKQNMNSCLHFMDHEVEDNLVSTWRVCRSIYCHPPPSTWARWSPRALICTHACLHNTTQRLKRFWGKVSSVEIEFEYSLAFVVFLSLSDRSFWAMIHSVVKKKKLLKFCQNDEFQKYDNHRSHFATIDSTSSIMCIKTCFYWLHKAVA